MGLGKFGLLAEQVGRADLHGTGTQGKSRRDTPAIGHATCGNHRHGYRIDNLWHQGKCTYLGRQLIAQKHRAVATGFVAHGNDRVTAVALQPLRFFNGGGGT